MSGGIEDQPEGPLTSRRRSPGSVSAQQERRTTCPAPSSPHATATMRANRSDSEIERALRRALHRRGLRFRKHLQVIPGLRCKPDVVFTRARVAVFVDGCFWHRCPLHASDPVANGDWWAQKLEANVARDRRNDAVLRGAGWTVIRLWEHQTVAEMAEIVERAVRRGPVDQPAEADRWTTSHSC